MKKLSIRETLTKVRKCIKKNDHQQAAVLCVQILREYPNNQKAIEQLKSLRSSAILEIGRMLHPPSNLLAELASLNRQGDFPQLSKRTEYLCTQYPFSTQLWNILGMSYAQQKDYDRALGNFEIAKKLNSKDTDALNNIGNIFKEKEDYGKAIEHYDKALLIRPGFCEALINKGICLKAQGKTDLAQEQFQLALSENPKNANALCGLAGIFARQKRYLDAIKLYEDALSEEPNLTAIWLKLAGVYEREGRLSLAISSYERAAKDNPADALSISMAIQLRKSICDWGYELNDLRRTLGAISPTAPAAPFATLSLFDDPREQLVRSKAFVAANFHRSPFQFRRARDKGRKRIRVGYFSADFCDHATMYLMSGLLRCHDREAFEVFCYSYGEPSMDRGHSYAKECADHFIDAYDLADIDLARLSRSHDLDIAVDLKGFTTDTRTRIFQRRLAPIQVNYLGYPGSIGADFIDYLVADHQVVPETQRSHYSENIIYLPYSYQPNDDRRQVSTSVTTRSDFNLPNDAFVFCCFNNCYKIGPREFDIWMRLLSKVERSVLWLIKSNEISAHNLKQEAERRNINPDRLIFAERCPHSEHLARHKHADLFIDTFNYNAHTTASDALWGGLPLVTLAGRQFAARVSASLLSAVDLPELITPNEEAYEALILELATDPERLYNIRRALSENLRTAPLFDTLRYTRSYEAGLKTAFSRYNDGKLPCDIWI